MHANTSSHIHSSLLQSQPTIVHFFSTRLHGFSTGVARSLNMGFTPEDQPRNTIANRKFLLNTINMPFENLTTVNQVHGCNIIEATEQLAGAGKDLKPSIAGAADALITNRPNIPIMVLTADCVPIILFDPRKKAIAAVHAGWRGTVARILEKTIAAMQLKYQSHPQDIVAAIGPSIGPCCYQVGNDVVERAMASLSKPESCITNIDNRYYFNLWEANRIQLLDNGVSTSNIDMLKLCTKCHCDLYFSSRANGGITGRMGACIMLR